MRKKDILPELSAVAVLLVFVLSGCRTTAAVVPDPGISTSETRDVVSQLGGQQAASAATSAVLEERNRNMAEQTSELAQQSAVIAG